MRRHLTLLGMWVVLLALPVGGIQAQEPDYWARFKLDYHRNQCWPKPFITNDRQVVRSYFAAAAASGWQAQNTLGSYLFHPNSQELNGAGRSRLHWIATMAPVNRRTVFVHQDSNPEITRMRVDSVQRNMARIVTRGPMPEVLVTHVPPPTTPGYYLDSINRQMQENVPQPILPAAGGGSSTSDSGGT